MFPVCGHRLGSQGLDLPASDDMQCEKGHGAAVLVIAKSHLGHWSDIRACVRTCTQVHAFLHERLGPAYQQISSALRRSHLQWVLPAQMCPAEPLLPFCRSARQALEYCR